MVRISGVILPDKKRTVVGLTYIYGIGQAKAEKVIAEAKVDADKRIGELSPEEENRLREVIRKMTTEGDLRRKVQQDIKRLKDIKSYRGTRHAKRLPCRGQRTKTNARTLRGKKVTMGSGKIKEQKK